LPTRVRRGDRDAGRMPMNAQCEGCNFDDRSNDPRPPHTCRQAEQITTLQAENVRLTAERDALCVRVENLKFDMNLVGAQLGISTREEIEPTVRKLLTDLTGEIERHAHAIDRAEAAESALAEAARRINCAGPVAHRIDVLRQEHEAQLRAARAQALEDAADLLNSAFWDIGGDDSAAEWLRARAASERKEPT
jgi:cell division protein FtsB